MLKREIYVLCHTLVNDLSLANLFEVPILHAQEITLSVACILININMPFLRRAYPINEYPCKTKQAAAIMLMIMNNLDHKVAQVLHLYFPSFSGKY